MQEQLTELMYRYDKKSKKWICYDEDGRTASGATKQLAKNSFYALYKVNLQLPFTDFNISDYNSDLIT